VTGGAFCIYGAKENYVQGIGGKSEGREVLGRPKCKCKFVIKRNFVEMCLEFLD
jgi:hypothetical protein